MDVDQLKALFAKNKTVLLGAAAAGVAGLALWQGKKKGPAGPASTTAGARVPGTIPAAAVVPAGGTYDSSSYDLYSALQPELAKILEQQSAQTGGTGSGITSAPDPIASGLLAPSHSGQYVGYSQGGIYEVESDGSLYHLSGPEWTQVIKARGGDASYTGIGGKAPGADYSHVGNLSSKIKNAAGVGSP